MVELFDGDAKLGAVGFTVHLPDGRREGGALPGVFVGCGVGLRAEALRAVGGLDRRFFMQAEEYDLAFRLVAAGWKVEVFGDVHVDHLKTNHARRGERTTFLDVRNNLRVIARYLPAPAHAIYRADCVQRYDWLSHGQGHEAAFGRGVKAGRRRGWLERGRFRRWRMSPSVFERFFRWEEIARRMGEVAGCGVRRIVLADFGKNIYPFVQAADAVGLTVAAVGDDRFAGAGRGYRGIPVTTLETALGMAHEAVVVSNTGPVHATRTLERLRGLTASPIHAWFVEPHSAHPGFVSSPPSSTSDDIAVAAIGAG